MKMSSKEDFLLGMVLHLWVSDTWELGRLKQEDQVQGQPKLERVSLSQTHMSLSPVTDLVLTFLETSTNLLT